MKDKNKTSEQLTAELKEGQALIEELKKAAEQGDVDLKKMNVLYNQLLAIFDGIAGILYVTDPETYEILYTNKALRDIYGEVRERKCYKIIRGLDSPCPNCTNDRIFGEYEGESYNWVDYNESNNRWYRCIDRAILWSDGKMVRCGVAIDIPEYKKTEDIIRRQSKEILELSIPVLQVWGGILVAPLIGTMDTERTQRFMEHFLKKIVETSSTVVLVDITGVPSVDTQTAQHFVESIIAARLLGTRVILTGISPAIAQTLVHLGVDMSDFETKSSLSAGLAVALKFLGIQLTSESR